MGKIPTQPLLFTGFRSFALQTPDIAGVQTLEFPLTLNAMYNPISAQPILAGRAIQFLPLHLRVPDPPSDPARMPIVTVYDESSQLPLGHSSSQVHRPRGSTRVVGRFLT